MAFSTPVSEKHMELEETLAAKSYQHTYQISVTLPTHNTVLFINEEPLQHFIFIINN